MDQSPIEVARYSPYCEGPEPQIGSFCSTFNGSAVHPNSTELQMKTSPDVLSRPGQGGALLVLSVSSLFFLLAAVTANAQQITGTPGSPSATTTINGAYLPPQPPQFGGVINLGATQSKPWWPPRMVPPKDAPNVLLIMIPGAAVQPQSEQVQTSPVQPSDEPKVFGVKPVQVDIIGPPITSRPSRKKPPQAKATPSLPWTARATRYAWF